ncbi:MAG: uracil-DNA glycosylase [Candidatus Marinimicrobia bacterium]|nr:uracil-DNA glycosylase [Candidatus Neomarinimicrobiota bacterium]
MYLNQLSHSNNHKKVKIHDSWYYELKGEFEKKYWIELSTKVKNSYKNKIIYPKPPLIFNAFNSTQLNDVKVVIIGQDPYHGQGQANGLSFSVNEGIAIPPSLLNIFKELESDLNIPIPNSGNLQSWANQGVLLLNTILTVEKDNANSHKDLGWEIFTKKAIEIVSSKLQNIVFILWGKQAHSIQDVIDKSKHHIITSVHPSPLSAHRGFFGSNPFSKTNNFLKSKDIMPINWKLN